jgi:2,3-bisphosphoglycerate-dependent phosphoglycerate mutase
MRSTLYLVRHAQSMPRDSEPCSDWRLSPVGLRQAGQLAGLLAPLGIRRVCSSPFTRSLQTAAPFAREQALAVAVLDDLRERVLATGPGYDLDELWRKSWDDFDFALPGHETSAAAQRRFCRALQLIAQATAGTTAVFTHGHVIALFLNTLERGVGRKEAEALTNPDVFKVEWQDGVFVWERAYRLAGLANIATDHGQTPGLEQPSPVPIRLRK